MRIRAMQKVLGQYKAHLKALLSWKEGPFCDSGLGDELEEGHIYPCHTPGVGPREIWGFRGPQGPRVSGVCGTPSSHLSFRFSTHFLFLSFSCPFSFGFCFCFSCPLPLHCHFSFSVSFSFPFLLPLPFAFVCRGTPENPGDPDVPEVPEASVFA